MTVAAAVDAPLWLAAESADERAEREAGWHWAWGAEPADGRLRAFVWDFALDAPLPSARLLVAAQKGLPGVWLDGRPLHLSDDVLAGRELRDLDLGALAAGPHRLAVEVRVFHPFIQEPRQGGVAALLRGDLPGGQRLLRPPTEADWRTRLAPAPGWQGPEAMLDDGWQPGRPPAATIDWQPGPPHPARLLRRAFTLAAAPVAATLTLTALGGCEAELNGQRVGDARLAPENSDFRVRLLVQQHDVTGLLRGGDNVLGVTVADGFYASEAIGRGRYPFGTAPRRLWAQLEATLPDGRRVLVGTDMAWRSAQAPVLFSEIYHGETHDARLEPPGWSSPAFDDSGWDAVWPAPVPACALQRQDSPPIRVTLELPPRRIVRLLDGDHVVDFGQNFAGVCRIRVRGEAGRTVTLRHAEVLADDGSVDMRNLRAARCTDRYTLRGDPAGEVWSPRFTYHGFRYVQLAGWPGELQAGDITGLVMHSDLPVTGHFSSTQPVLLELYRIRRGLISVLSVAIVFTALVSLALGVTISRPLSKLSRAAQRIARGEREVPVPLVGSGEIRELSESFATMTHELDARMRYISDFAADVAHEFKSPLTSIRGAAELLATPAEARARSSRTQDTASGRCCSRMRRRSSAASLGPQPERTAAVAAKTVRTARAA